jgi:gliding motility-associated-like protein
MKKLLILLLSTFVLTNNAKSADIVFEKATIYLNAFGIAVIDNSFIKNVSNNSSVYSMFIDKDTFTDEEIGENWVTLTVTDIYGNEDYYTSIVTVMDTLKPVLNCQDALVYLNASGEAVIDNSIINNGSKDNSSISNISLDKYIFDIESIGGNWVTITVTDIHGNVDHCTSILTVLDTFDRAINTVYSDSIISYAYVPNAFTPNNDGVNDVFTPVSSDYAIKNYEFSVYNLSREMIFKTNSNSEGWNGNFRGVEIPEGDYVWTLTTSSKGGNNIQSQKGYVKLIR